MLLENVILYKTASMKENEVWGRFNIEILENKARVFNRFPGWFGEKTQSRLNNLIYIGGVIEPKRQVNYYTFVVNGNKVYFKKEITK